MKRQRHFLTRSLGVYTIAREIDDLDSGITVTWCEIGTPEWVAEGMVRRLNAVGDMLRYARENELEELYAETIQHALSARSVRELKR